MVERLNARIGKMADRLFCIDRCVKRCLKNESSWSSCKSTVSSILELCSVIVHLHLNRYPCYTYPAASKAAGDSGQRLSPCPENLRKHQKPRQSCRSHRRGLHRPLRSSPGSDPAPQKCGLRAGSFLRPDS